MKNAVCVSRFNTGDGWSYRPGQQIQKQHADAAVSLGLARWTADAHPAPPPAPRTFTSQITEKKTDPEPAGNEGADVET